MRITKYRVWDEVGKRLYPWKIDISNYLKLDGTTENNFTLQQYTGLKDKKLNDIYEGDILKIEFHPLSGEKPLFYPVEFVDGSFCIKCNPCDGYASIYDGEYEVVGNIFENPELLK
jgi:uncharacterized phage protein (TIGR01671 family)